MIGAIGLVSKSNDLISAFGTKDLVNHTEVTGFFVYVCRAKIEWLTVVRFFILVSLVCMHSYSVMIDNYTFLQPNVKESSLFA